MLSLLSTAVLLLVALLVTLHLRSVLRIAVSVALAAAAFLVLARRPLDDLAQPRTHWQYKVDAEHAAAPGPELAARAGAVALARVRGLGLQGADVQVRSDTIDIQTRAGEEDVRSVQETLATIGVFELAAVDDDFPFFEGHERDPDLPRGLQLQPENTPLGPGRSATRWYATQQRAEAREGPGGEDMAETLRRFQLWTGTLSVPGDKRIAFEKVIEHGVDEGIGYQPDVETWEEVAWRTYVLARTPLLTGGHIHDARAYPDKMSGYRWWQVSLQLTSEGGRLFEEATERLRHRRIAIVLDSVVESAPVVMSRITGGTALISVAAGSPQEQASRARKLEAILRSGPLPAPLALAAVDRNDAVIDAATLDALVIAATLVFIASLVFALWLTFRRPGVRPAPAA